MFHISDKSSLIVHANVYVLFLVQDVLSYQHCNNLHLGSLYYRPRLLRYNSLFISS